MIKKRIKKIFKLTFLIAVRQIWKLLCNLYQIIEQPFLALKTLIIKRDKSQIFLIGAVILSPILGYFVARIFWDYYRFGFIVPKTGMFFLISGGVEIIVLTYIGYWIFKVMKHK